MVFAHGQTDFRSVSSFFRNTRNRSKNMFGTSYNSHPVYSGPLSRNKHNDGHTARTTTAAGPEAKQEFRQTFLRASPSWRTMLGKMISFSFAFFAVLLPHSSGCHSFPRQLVTENFPCRGPYWQDKAASQSFTAKEIPRPVAVVWSAAGRRLHSTRQSQLSFIVSPEFQRLRVKGQEAVLSECPAAVPNQPKRRLIA